MPPPGIGAYTGAAIASIACGERAAVVDANVVRVLARLLKIGDDPSSKAAARRFAAEAAALLSPERPGDFNQARRWSSGKQSCPAQHVEADQGLRRANRDAIWNASAIHRAFCQPLRGNLRGASGPVAARGNPKHFAARRR